MKYSKARRHVYLIPLHVCGFISIPNFHRYPWMNKLHNNVYRKYLCVVFVVAVSLQVASTFIHAIRDLPEFLQRLYESALVSSCVVDFVFYNTRLNQIIELFDLQEEVFKVTNKKIHRKYLKMEFYEVGMFLVFCILMLVGLLSQTFLPRSDENLNLIRTLYRRKYPTRILPFNMWTPSFIDVSEMKYFVILYFFDVYGLVVILTLVFERILLQIVFPTSLLGQYEMLAEFVKLIGAEHRDKYGESIFYTDIAHGTYITETQILERIG
ncbi:hypothetical protein M8J77_005828 [Diaphorina citri]|nr:hypothetical protein M8J77_005828 [Diaphorina citri]